MSLPQHIAIIMDGNGRWASKRHLPRLAGHRAGMTAARHIVQYCAKREIPVLSLFAFSSENWRRSSQEINDLMNLFVTGLEQEMEMLIQHHVRLRFIGDRSKFNKRLLDKMHEAEQLTGQNTKMTLLIAVDYSGQWDILQAAKRLSGEVEAGRVSAATITADLFQQNLSFADLPDPDLFIRTSGEVRLSNFMLWQIAYAELYFTDILWPDFNETELEKAMTYFSSRERRYGGRNEHA
jgi:undecaprenyl diphosphate synthase